MARASDKEQSPLKREDIDELKKMTWENYFDEILSRTQESIAKFT